VGKKGGGGRGNRRKGGENRTQKNGTLPKGKKTTLNKSGTNLRGYGGNRVGQGGGQEKGGRGRRQPPRENLKKRSGTVATGPGNSVVRKKKTEPGCKKDGKGRITRGETAKPG